MGDAQVDQNQLEQIGKYVKSHIGQWLKTLVINSSNLLRGYAS